MSRGQGLENVKEFNWVKQPNGRYTIFDVPIFGVFEDEKRGAVGIDDLQSVIRFFNENKRNNFHYPRIHIGHHEKTENRPGAGYLDNLNLRGDTIYADLVEITPDVFEQIIKEMKFPYVSAEYNPEKQQITSLALLESQSPYFKYPLLALAPEPQETVSFQSSFSDWENRSNTILKFQENFQEGEDMEDKDDEKEDRDDSTKEEFCGDPEGTEKDAMVEDKSKNYNCQEEMGGLREKIDRLLSLVEEIHDWEKEEHENGGMEDEDDMGEPSEPMPPEDNEMGSPSSVAYQANNGLCDAINRQQKALLKMQHEISQIGRRVVSNDAHDSMMRDKSRLRKICDDRGLNFQAEYKKLQLFSSDSDRNIYLDTISMIQPPARHPATRMLQKFAAENPKEKLISRYQGNNKNIAMQAYDAYQDTLANKSESERNKFQASWPSVEKFIDFAVKDPKSFKFMLE